MTSPPQAILVECPSCKVLYADWYRASVNLGLDKFDDEYMEQVRNSTCPHCGHKTPKGALIVRKDGTWELPPEADRQDSGPTSD